MSASAESDRPCHRRPQNNPVYDIERFGLKFVASPRHADILLVTGTVTWNMRQALERTSAATPDQNGSWPLATARATVAFFAGNRACAGPVSATLPVDLHVAGCPPAPIEILKGLSN
jgi:Ni,Fe-hydrogenase III small subunit